MEDKSEASHEYLKFSDFSQSRYHIFCTYVCCLQNLTRDFFRWKAAVTVGASWQSRRHLKWVTEFFFLTSKAAFALCTPKRERRFEKFRKGLQMNLWDTTGHFVNAFLLINADLLAESPDPENIFTLCLSSLRSFSQPCGFPPIPRLRICRELSSERRCRPCPHRDDKRAFGLQTFQAVGVGRVAQCHPPNPNNLYIMQIIS